MSTEQQNKKTTSNELIDKFLEHRRNPIPNDDEHCLEYAGEINGVTFLNDSKATRVTRTKYSLESIDAPIILILGGNDTENDYSILGKMVRDKVKAIVYLGTDNNKVLNHFIEEYLLFVKADSIKEAVKISSSYGVKGEVVLFSPACASDTEFENYQLRGWEFKREVQQLSKKTSPENT